MLAFFRKYQKYFYTLITVIIVISFSFFGTYGATQDDGYQDVVVFTAVDGSAVKRSELERMALFLGTDARDMQNFGGVWGPNFFNDGVIEKDILKTGIGAILLQQYAKDLRPDFESRKGRESRFEPYRHPGNPAISAVEIWNRFNPEMARQFEQVKAASNPLSQDALDARIELYLAERSYSGNDLKQSLMYIEQMNSEYMRPDPNLPYTDLSMFGYHTVEDWFGQRFIRLVSQFIINSAKIAEARGYEVSQDEVLADLIQNAQISYVQNSRYGRLGVTDATQYFKEQLRRMRMDQRQAINTWRQVMLFRRMFQDVGNSAVTDAFTYEQFLDYAGETVVGEEFSLPEGLELNSFRDLQQFQAYLREVAPKSDDPLALPREFLSMDEVSDELIQQNYLVELGEVSKTELQTRVGIRQMWNWQVREENWNSLQKQFPELADAEAGTEEERRIAVDSLDDITRSRLDAYSRKRIVEENPEWAREALERGTKQRKNLSVRRKGGVNPLSGVDDRIAFIDFLNDPEAEKPRVYTPDDQVYYLITVIEKAERPTILTFSEAKEQGVLSEILDRQLQAYYERIREASPKTFQAPDGGWQELHYVKDEVAKRYFSKVLDAIAAETGIQTPDAASTYRFLPYMRTVQMRIKADPSLRDEYVRSEGETERPARLGDQWKLEAVPFTLDRSSNQREALTAEPGTWTEPKALPNGAIAFKFIKGRETLENGAALTKGVKGIHRQLSDGSQQLYTLSVLDIIRDKGAISLSSAQAND